MKSDTKKIFIYAGGALLIGAVGFFVYSFFKKNEIVVGNSTISLGDEENQNQNGFINPNFDFKPIDFNPNMMDKG